MRQASDRASLRALTRPWRRKGRVTVLVPTMGNLHEGHLALLEAAHRHGDRVIVSLFVNPAQFDRGEDFKAYPRTLDADLEKLRKAGCDLVFTPDEQTMYPRGLEHAIRLTASPDLAQRLEGRFRPGHFDGVVTVVARLFCLVMPDIAVFGEKDYQQLLIVQRLVEDLGFDIRIEAVPTVRERNGLAMSSRNRLLDAEQQTAASALSRALQQVIDDVRVQGLPHGEAEQRATAALQQAGLRVEYVAIRRARDLQAAEQGDRNLRVLVAAWCGGTRLIDNKSLD
ncbi:MAG: pantoate--beta-alanine ligase [Xanthomonadales bacterium]|nr:pantoate--beta-alanine ligase [Xanthomonadales bacterium]